MNPEYEVHAAERKSLGIPPLPLSRRQTEELVKLLSSRETVEKPELRVLLEERVSPGVSPAAEVKAEFLYELALGKTACPLINAEDAVRMLGAMLGGYNLTPLIELLKHKKLGATAADALSHTLLVFDRFNEVFELAGDNENAKDVIESWAAAEWFLSRPEAPEEIKVVVFKVDGEINTDDLSPATEAATRPDIPLHALSMGMNSFPKGIKEIARLKKESGLPVAFVGDVVGTGSSRKSAANSLIWHIGDDIPGVPNKRRGGVVIGGKIAPIFFNTCEDSGALPLECDVSRMKTGRILAVRLAEKRIIDAGTGEELAEFDCKPNTLPDEYRAGGRIPLIIGKQLTARAREALHLPKTDTFIKPLEVVKEGVGFSLAQKIVGRACNKKGVYPGTACLPKMTTVGSQDTTGPMTADEIVELANLNFQADFVMQSFCHTAAAPKPADKEMHRNLPGFFTSRGGVVLKPGDGVIHSWLNRFILPDTVGTGGDSHTRFPIGVSFPAGSGLVAFAAALGVMPLEMPESVLVKFTGSLQEGVTLRDAVYAIPFQAIKDGLLTVPPENKKNVFNARILEMRGMPDLEVEQAFEMTDTSAERSAAAATFALNIEPVARYMRSNAALMNRMLAERYQDSETLKRRIERIDKWLEKPALLEADKDAEYAAEIRVNLNEIKEPLLACPNNPDDIRPLSEIAGEKIDEVFIGSCMTNIGHFRAAAAILEDAGDLPVKLWVTPPTKMDRDMLIAEGCYQVFDRLGADIEVPGCSLCMGNQKRVRPGATALSTSTRNFPDRMGDGANVFLGSAELGAVTARLGRLPRVDEYMEYYRAAVSGRETEIYRYLRFDE